MLFQASSSSPSPSHTSSRLPRFAHARWLRQARGWMAMLCASLLFSFSITNASGQQRLVDITSGALTSQGGNDLSQGYSFTLTTPLTISGLGILSSGAGLATTHFVGLWNTSGTLLISSLVSNASPIAINTNVQGTKWIFDPFFSPVQLAAGTYVLSAGNSMGSLDVSFILASSQFSGGAVFGTAYASSGSTTAFPTGAQPGFGQGVFGPNLLIAPAYWKGGVDGTWAGANWTADAAGGSSPISPVGVNAIFSATGAANQGSTTLGQNFAINSLTVQDAIPVVINSGAGGPYTLTIGNQDGVAIKVNTGSTLTINANVVIGTAGNGIDVAGVATINGTVGGINGITKSGAGTLTLTNAGNTYTGGTAINGGTLVISSNGQLGNVSGALSFANGGILRTTADITTNRNTTLNAGGGSLLVDANTTLTMQGVITGGAGNALTKTGLGTLILTNASNTYAGGTVISDGVLSISSDGNLGDAAGTVTFNGGRLRTTADISMNRAMIFGVSGGVIDVAGGTTLTQAGSLSGASTNLIKIGDGNLTLTGSSVFSSNIYLNSGNLTLTGSTASLNLGPGNIEIGSGSPAVITVSAGAQLTTNNAFIGTLTHGSAVVTGANSLWTGSYIYVRNPSGTVGGDLQILDGGTVSSVEGYVGYGDMGTARVSGTNSLWTIQGSLVVGFDNIAHPSSTLTVENGGKVVSDLLELGLNNGRAKIFLNGSLVNGRGTLETRGILSHLIGTIDIDGGVIRATASNLSFIAGFDPGEVTLGDGGVFIDTNGNNIGIAISLDGTGGLTKLGAGTLTFSGSQANSFSGTTTVTAGTLVLAKSGSATSVAGDLVIGNSTGAGAPESVVVRLNTVDQTTSSTDVTIFTDGWLDLNIGAFATINIGSLTMTGGKVSIYDRILTLSGDVTVNASAGGSVISSTDSFNNLTFGNGTRTFTIADGSATYDLNVQAGVGFGTLIKAGPGVMRMAGVTNNALSVRLNSGTLALASNTALGGGTFTLAGGTVAADSGNRTIANAISLTGDATIGASLELALRTISFTGAMTLTGSRALTVNNNALTTFAAVNMGSNALTLGGTGAVTITGGLTGTGGSLVKNGASRLKLTGASTYTGGTTVNLGVLEVNNTLGSATGSGAVLMKTGTTLTGNGVIHGIVTMEDGAILAPGNSPGTLTVGELILNAATRLEFELGQPQPPGIAGTNSDLVNVTTHVNGSNSTGNLQLAGILDLTANAGFGTGTYRLFNYGGTLTGTGATMPFGSAPAGYNLVVDTSTAGQVNLIVNYDGLQFWDGGNTTPGFVANGSGGDGTWNATNTNWTNQNGNANNEWSDLTAVFAGTAGTVQVATPGLQIAGLHFKTGGYTLADGGGSLDVGTGAELRIDPTLTATIAAPLIGTGGITKTGDGTIILSGTNTYEGGTDINAGILSISADVNLGTAPASAVADHLEFNGGTLQATASFTLDSNRGITLTGAGILDVTETESLEYGGIITGAGALEKSGTGTLVLLGANDFSGGTTVSAGTLHLGDGQTAGAALGSGNVTIDTAGTLTLNLANAETFATGVTDNGHFIADGATGEDYTISSLITGTGDFEKTGSNTVTLLGANDYSGGTTVSGGNLIVGDGTTTGVLVGTDLVTIDTAGTLTLRLANGETFANEVTNNGHFIADGASGVDYIISTAISGTGDFEKTGANTVTLTGDSDFSGGTTISAGVLQLGDGNAKGSITGNVLNNASLVFNHSVDTAFDGVISGSGTVTKQNTNVLTFTAANSYSGGTTINSGRMVTTHASALGTGPVTLNAGAILAPTGVLHMDSLTWNGGEIALNPLDGDLLEITGAFTNGGNGGTFILGALELGNNTLATFGSTDFTVPIFISANPDVDYGVYAFFVNGTSLQLNAVSATATGPLLQNSGPVYIPTFADFTVNGRAATGTPSESNTINSLIFLPGSSLQVFNNLTVTSGNFTVTGGKAIISGGTVLVPGEFHKFGTGILDSRSAFQVDGNTLIHDGALSVNGTFQTPLLHVLQNGTLMGNGIVIGNVLNDGTVAPGNSIGLLTIRGDYRQTSSGTLEIEVAGPGNHDVLVVSGHVRLGGTLEIASLGYKPKYGDQIPFLRAGRITGKFNHIEMPNPAVNRGRFLNLGNVGVLIVAPTSYTLVATTPNQTRVAGALDEWIGIEDGDIGETTLALDLLREEQYPQAFEAIMPGFHEAALSTGIELIHSQGQLLHQQLSARRLGQRTAQVDAGHPLPVMDGGKGAKKVLAAQPQIAAVSDEHWSTWFQGSGLFSQGGMSLVPGEDFESGNFLVGADYAISEHVALGLFAAYGEGWGDYDNGGEIDLERVTFGGYATVDIDQFYFNAAFGIGTVEYDIKRPIQFATLSRNAHSDPDGTEFFGLLGGGYDVQRGNWTFGPQFSVQYSRIALDSFTERGADSLDLRIDDPEAESLRSYLGARVAYTIKVSESTAIIPELRAFWQHEYLDGESLHASLDGGNGPGFLYDPEKDDKDALYLGAGVGFQIGPRLYANIYYNVDLGREEPSHNVSLSATVRF